MTLQHEKFEELVADQLKASLDPQRGKALAAFRAHIAANPEETAPAPIPISRGLKREVSRRALWFWTGVPSLVAAGLAVVVMLQLGVGGGKGITPADSNFTAKNSGSTGASGAGGAVVASSVELTQNQTGGVVVSNDKPMREVRQQTVRQAQWIDPNDHATYTVTVPTEKVDYVQVRPD